VRRKKGKDSFVGRRLVVLEGYRIRKKTKELAKDRGHGRQKMVVDISCFAVDPNPAGKATKSRSRLQAIAIEVMLAVLVPCIYSIKTKEGNWSTGQPG